MSFSIAGKTAIVTGAANGIGRAIGAQEVHSAQRDRAHHRAALPQLPLVDHAHTPK